MTFTGRRKDGYIDRHAVRMTLAASEWVIVGAGSLGQSFAALLARGGQAVTLLATPRSASRLRANGAIRLRGAVEAVVKVEAEGVVVTSEASDVPDGAVVLFATKGYDLAAAIDTVQ